VFAGRARVHARAAHRPRAPLITAAPESATELDPRRWIAATVAIVSVAIPVLDNTVLNVAVPTILREFHTDLPSLQWVITGYALTIASLLVIGGRLGDLYGHRRTFVIGALIFAFGSGLASISTSVPTLFVGEALIEGIGASLMFPATLSIISTTFVGAERAKAFAAWGAAAGAAVAFGPFVGGFLTTVYSWRWALRINVIIAPVLAICALVFMRPDQREGVRPRLDLPGAALFSAGIFSLVFGLSESVRYGWWQPVRDFTMGPWTPWPESRSVSIVPIAFMVSALLLTAFVFVERAKERHNRDPLFEFGQLRHLGFRYGLLTTMVLAMGQFALLFVLPVLLQDGLHMSALRTGAWMVPTGVMIAVGAPIGGRLTRRINVTSVVRTGLVLEAVGLVLVAAVVSPHVTFLQLLPGSIVFGVGVGFASSQLTNVILSDIDPDKAGVGSGTNATVRQVGWALGTATFAGLLSAQSIRHGVAALQTAALAPATKASAITQLQDRGVNFHAPSGVSARDAVSLHHIVDAAVAAGARPALLFGAGVVSLGALLSTLIPPVPPARAIETMTIVPEAIPEIA
jgi:EmrB/QacA subfamily drug resistance transporter